MSVTHEGIGVIDLVRQPGNLAVYQRLAADAEAQNKPPAVLAFWKYLLLCFETPRPSTDYAEPDVPSRLDKIRQALSKVAVVLGAEAIEDDAGNLIIRREGRGSGANKPWLCLQAHLDMVVSQNEGVGHNFEIDPIEVRFSSDDGLTDGWLKPLKATTLGADNGVGLAASLAMLEVVESHPPLELLFTSNEETNFWGADHLQPGSLKSKRLLNLDSEDEATVIIGSAGIFEHHFKLPVERSPTIIPDTIPVSIKLTGLHGGHSGVDIHKEYCNANKLLACLMLAVSLCEFEMRLLELSGGSGPTAIPREASCVVCVPRLVVDRFSDEVSAQFEKIKEELRRREPAIDLSISVCSEEVPGTMTDIQGFDSSPPPPPPLDAPPLPLVRKKKGLMSAWQCARCEKCVAKSIELGGDIGVAETVRKMARKVDLGPISIACTRKIWQFCSNMPSGVLHMSTEVSGLVESSVNFGVATLLEDHLFCHVCARSSVASFLESYKKTLSAFGELANAANVENICPGPPWQPRTESPFLSVLKKTHASEFGKEPHVTVIHAGLEPGSIMDSLKDPDLDCCSIGPRVENPHSPDERVNISSADRFVLWIQKILETLAKD